MEILINLTTKQNSNLIKLLEELYAIHNSNIQLTIIPVKKIK